MSKGLRKETRLGWGGRVSKLGVASGPVFFFSRSSVVGEGQRAGGREEFLKGNNGVKGGVKGGLSPQMC